MSPHAVSQPHQTDELLAQFAVTRDGFIPDETPLQRLPYPYYAKWETIAHHLSSALEDGTLRAEVDRLPVLSTTYLTTEAEWRRAYVVLAFLAHAYIWGGVQASEVLPPSIAVPLLQVSVHLELPPVATYAALNLWNFTSTSPDFADLDSLHAPLTFTGTRDESWFYVLSVAMEAQGGRLIPNMLSALDAVKRRDYPLITQSLHDCIECIHGLGRLLERMDEHCAPATFYHRIRPFLAGSRNMASTGLPRGVFFDLGAGQGEWMQLRGGSNGQSSLVQFLDIFLGVEHTSQGKNGAVAAQTEARPATDPALTFHEEVRGYMPGPHRRFLEHASRMGSIKNLAARVGGTAEQVAFREAFQAATRALGEFRNKHLQLVTRYIIIPSRQRCDDGRLNLATASTREVMSGEDLGKTTAHLTGTGGTALLPFLKQSRDETYEAGELSEKS